MQGQRMTAPSLKAARARLSTALATADDWHTDALGALPDGHSWRDVDLLDIRSARHRAAHDTFEAAQREFEQYCIDHPNE
jgi:hypothetical protein